MPLYEVDIELLISCTCKVRVEADNADEADETASRQMPDNFQRSSQKGWSANVSVKPPKGVDLRVVKAYHFQTASGPGAKKPKRVSADQK